MDAQSQFASDFSKALVFATEKHAGQFRKGTSIPYISHPIAVASLVLEYGGDTDQAAAALLHDTIEDCGVTHEQLTQHFGPKVAQIVLDCTDAETLPKPPWRQRKETYVAHLAKVNAETLLVSACDKLHNSRAICHDVAHFGGEVWKRFSAAPEDILWYYEALLAAFERRRSEGGGRFDVLVDEFGRTVARMTKLSRSV